MTARVNLLPREIEEKAKARRATSWAIGAVAAYAAILGLLYIAKLGDLGAARDERDAAQEVVDQREADLASLQEFAELDRQLTARNDLLAASMATEISWARVMNDLALTFPPSSSLLTLAATTENAEEAGIDGGAPADPNSESVAALVFDGYSVERFAPGVERVLVKFDEIEAFFNVYLAQANEVQRGETEVTSFGGTAQLNDNAYTNRYAEGLPPEVGQ